MSSMLNCELDKNQLALIISMIEEGANPESLSVVANEMVKLKHSLNNKIE